jgi:hypothetical protein
MSAAAGLLECSCTWNVRVKWTALNSHFWEVFGDHFWCCRRLGGSGSAGAGCWVLVSGDNASSGTANERYDHYRSTVLCAGFGLWGAERDLGVVRRRLVKQGLRFAPQMLVEEGPDVGAGDVQAPGSGEASADVDADLIGQ